MSSIKEICPVIKTALSDALGWNETQLSVAGMRWSPQGKLESFDDKTGKVVIITGGCLAQKLTLHAANVVAVGTK